MNEQVYFYPTDSLDEFPVETKDDILDALNSIDNRFAEVKVESDGESIIVTARISGDIDWLQVGKTTALI